MARRSGLLILLCWAALLFACLLSLTSGVSAAEDAAVSASCAEASPRVEVVLDLPYGSGRAEVGVARSGNDCDCWVPVWPAMFQMTADETLWVLDTVNSRVLAFRDGKQTADIPTAAQKKRPTLFAVSRDAIWVKQAINKKGEGPEFFLLRYDRRKETWDTVSLRLWNDGPQLDPMEIRPLAADETTLLLRGTLYPMAVPGVAQQADAVLMQDGELAVVPEGDGAAVPATDGSVWRFRVINDTVPSELPFELFKLTSGDGKWDKAAQGALPRREELSQLRRNALTLPLGLDKQRRLAVVLSEGRPLSQRLVQVALSGAVATAVTLEDMGYDSAPLSMYFAPSHYQLLPDGSILAQYASPERYKIIRICLDD